MNFGSHEKSTSNSFSRLLFILNNCNRVIILLYTGGDSAEQTGAGCEVKLYGEYILVTLAIEPFRKNDM
ncbi:hypothetical protein D3C71_1979840 [compost metagenome]